VTTRTTDRAHSRLAIKSLVAAILILATTACGLLPVPRLVFDTPQPSATVAPPPTPLPAAMVTFQAHVPTGTPAGSAPAVQLLDPAGGAPRTVVLANTGNNLWSGGVSATLGAVLRYRYIRPLPTLVAETTPAQQPVSFRLLAVTSASTTADDIVAGWTDFPFAGAVGGMDGRVWNGNSGQGVMGVLVEAGGQQTISGQDGSFVFQNLPAGSQRATLLAPDGSLSPAQKSVKIGDGQTVPVDLVSADPNAVHLTFLVQPPPGTDANAVLRLAGDQLVLGDTFVPAASGSSISAAREPVLVPLADGRWTVRLQLYAGTVLHYKYTLGDGAYDGELDANGSPRLRELVVPMTDALVDDTIDSWQGSGAPKLTFEALTPPSTPSTDVIALQLRPAGSAWLPPLPMWRVDVNDWRLVLYNPADFAGSVSYRYCRNYACGTADDAATAGSAAAGRFFSEALFDQTLRDNVTDWQWLAGPSGGAGVLPAIQARPSFAAGFDLDDGWQPGALPFYAQTFSGMHADGAGWVNATRLAAAQMQPAPVFADDPALAPLPADWSALVSTAHNAGLRVGLHPVTCHYTPYGACDYWNGVNFGGGFWDKWFSAYERYLLSEAALARASGADQLVIGDFKLRPSFPGEPEAPPDAEARWRGLITRVRAVYGGPLAFELLMGSTVWPSPPPFLDAVDVIRVWWWAPLSKNNRPGIGDMAGVAGVLLDGQLLPLQQRFKKPVQLSAAYLSADGAATQCLRRADGKCHDFQDFAPSAPDVTGAPLALPEQGDIYQALLAAVNARSWVGGFFSYGYNPVADLRDKSLSVRGKPAEGILAAWFPKLQGH
jgi:hypothetical protein